LLPAFRQMNPDSVIDLQLADLARVTSPVCLLHGSEDEFFPLRSRSKWQQPFPNAELQLIEGQSHSLNLSSAVAGCGVYGTIFGEADHKRSGSLVAGTTWRTGQSMKTVKPVILAPSILTADFGHLAEQVAAAEQGGRVGSIWM
jgi:hypothetical protein